MMIKKMLLLVVLYSPSVWAQSKWTQVFEDAGTVGRWEDRWFLDGKLGSVTYTDKGLLFKAGRVADDNAAHAVLWTKKVFGGDLKLAYDFTRVDTSSRGAVIIVYLLAEGIGEPPYVKDILKWQELRVIPFMHIYWWGMNAIHVSYATRAIGDPNEKESDNYVRARVYPVHPGTVTFKQTEVPPSFSGEDLFKLNTTYHLTFTKVGNDLTFEVKGEGKIKTYQWNTDRLATLQSGRVGIRQMLGRQSLYKNVKIFTKVAQ